MSAMPIIQNTVRERQTTEEARLAVLSRREARMRFWMGIMDADEEFAVQQDAHGSPILPSYPDRIRASELAGKADGDFVDRQEINVVTTYREMILSRAGQLVELEPPVETMCIDMDVAETDDEYEEEIDVEYALPE